MSDKSIEDIVIDKCTLVIDQCIAQRNHNNNIDDVGLTLTKGELGIVRMTKKTKKTIFDIIATYGGSQIRYDSITTKVHAVFNLKTACISNRNIPLISTDDAGWKNKQGLMIKYLNSLQAFIEAIDKKLPHYELTLDDRPTIFAKHEDQDERCAVVMYPSVTLVCGLVSFVFRSYTNDDTYPIYVDASNELMTLWSGVVESLSEWHRGEKIPPVTTVLNPKVEKHDHEEALRTFLKNES